MTKILQPPESSEPIAILVHQVLRQHNALLGVLGCLEELVMAFNDHVCLPDRNCSCHIAPPCGDCEQNMQAREALQSAMACIANPPQPPFDR